ncbi:MAG TPA: metal ABC transporter substrate-binding protein, partial [Burkholderiales bacterium]|nr:metal ABC transporter substrate-binding protein [Burkholderiales bacterium]
LAVPERAHAQPAFSIVTTTTDLKSLAEAVGGNRVSVVALVPPNVDAEEYQPKPHDLNRLKGARLALRVGVDYDLWFDRLAQQTGNRAIARGGAAYVDCSFGIALLDIRGAQVGPSGGHAHGSGNPHYWLDPANAEMMTAVILEALARNDPDNARYYEGQRVRFLDDLKKRTGTWEKALASVQGKPLIAYHNTWAYFARRFRVNFAGYIEPRPGVPPSASQLAGLIRLAQSQQVHAIVRQPHEPGRNVDFLAGKTGARVVILASSVGAVPAARDYLTLIDYNVATLADALQDSR